MMKISSFFISVCCLVFRFLDDFESNVIYDMPEPRLLGPGDSQLLDQSSDR
jgi:hypothetical protein